MLASITQPPRSAQPARVLMLPFGSFDLLESLKHRQSYDDDDLKFAEMWDCPTYLIANVERIIAGESYSTEAAFCACIEHSLGQLDDDERKDRWVTLRQAATSKKQDYPDPEDWDVIEELVRTFPFSIPDLSTKRRKRKFRMPDETRKQVHAVADKLGISMSNLMQVLILDALRVQDGVMHVESMNETVDSFYRKLRKRTRLLAGVLLALEVSLTPELQELIQEVGF